MADVISGIVNALMGNKTPTSNLVPQQPISIADKLNTAGATIPFEDIRDDPMARGMDRGSLTQSLHLRYFHHKSHLTIMIT